MAHYYDANGRLVAQQPTKSKPGQFRDTTITDARAQRLFPSVTTIIAELDKPAVDKWRIEQAVLACIADPITAHELNDPDLFDAYVKRLSIKAGEKAKLAAEAGTEIHAAISDLIRGYRVSAASHGMMAARIAQDAWLWMKVNGFEVEHTEKVFVNRRLGFAGTIDILGTFYGKPIIADIKTQEWDWGDKVSFHEPEYPLQLAGYDLGLADGIERDRMSIVINRNLGVHEPQLFNWSKPKDREPGIDQDKKWDDRFKSLLEYWKCAKSYWPEGLHAVRD